MATRAHPGPVARPCTCRCRIPGTPLPRTAPPPPLPTGFRERAGAEAGKGRARWLKWAGFGLAAYFIFGRAGVRQAAARPRDAAAAAPPRPSPASRRGDGAARPRIKTEVEKVLEDDPRTKRRGDHVNVDEGEVTLTGHVHERKLALEADRLARTVAGVTDVSNEIELRAPSDHRATVPRAEAVLAVPAPPGRRAGAALPAGSPSRPAEALTRDLPVAQLVKAGQRKLEGTATRRRRCSRSRAALSIDPRTARPRRARGTRATQRARRSSRSGDAPAAAAPPGPAAAPVRGAP